MRSKSRALAIACGIAWLTNSPCFAQSANSQINSGTIKSFAVNTSSSFTVNTNATSSPGVQAIAEGNLILQPASSLTTNVDCITTGCNGSLSQANGLGTSNSVLLMQGASGAQSLYIDPASTFKTSVNTGTATQTNTQNTGTASSGLTAGAMMSITEQTSTFTNTLTNNY